LKSAHNSLSKVFDKTFACSWLNYKKRALVSQGNLDLQEVGCGTGDRHGVIIAKRKIE
jgi:hypothetical protein